MPYIFSTLSTNQLYTKYHKSENNDLARVDRTVLVKGGANVADKHFITPRGVVTEVSDEDCALLKETPLFKMHVENGYLTVEEKSANVDKVVDNMTAADKSAPLTPQSFEVEDKAPPVNNKKRK